MSRPPADTSSDIAVIGLALRFPGSDTLAGLVGHLTAGRSLISEVPEIRWSKERWFGDPRGGAEKTRSVWGGFIDDAECFDAAFFSISPREASTMDPQQRLTLELAWRAVEDAGYRASALAGSDTGVFMGVSHSDYAELMERDAAKIDAYLPTGTDFAVVANRVSYQFDFRGPSIVNDTACARSLVSIHQAVAAIRAGECGMALAGGVNLAWSPKLFVAFSQAGMLSPTGRSHAFDKGADGFVRGEGGAVLLLKPLAHAVEDGDPVHAVIKGTGTNHGGRTNSLTVTNPAAQADLIEGVYTRAGVSVGSVGYIEAHGPGTPVGDPIEVLGLKWAFERMHAAEGTRPLPASCGIGSVKTNIGHLEAAAGVAGIVKVIGALTTRTLPATVNFTRPSRLINFDDSPFYVVRDTQPWQVPAGLEGGTPPRRAGVSSFGFGGANAHCLLEEYTGGAAPGAADDGRLQVVPLSARNEERLRVVARELLDHLTAVGTDAATLPGPRPATADIAHTLQTGREPMRVRRAFAVTGPADLLQALEDFLDGRPSPHDVRPEHPLPAEDPTGYLTAARDWARGEDVDWQAVRASAAYPAARRVRLPGYPFERVPHWYAVSEDRRRPAAAPPEDGHGAADVAPRVEAAVTAGSRDRHVVSAVVTAPASRHPLLHRNTSVLSGLRFSSTFTGDEPFLDAHRVRGARVMPAAAYVEMVRAAVERAVERDSSADPVTVVLRDVTWSRPLVVGDAPVDVHVELTPGENDTIAFRVCQGGADDGAVPTVHSQGTAEVRPRSEETAAVGLDALTAASEPVTVSEVYAGLRRQGLYYGPAMRALRELRTGEHGALARIAESDDTGTGAGDGLVLPPSVLDAAFQASVALMTAGATEAPRDPVMPFVLEEIEIAGPCPAETWAWVRRAESRGMVDKFDIDLTDDEGRVAARVRGLVQRTASARPAAPERQPVLTAATTWAEAPLAGDAASDPRTVVHAYLAGARVTERADTPFVRLPRIARDRVADGVRDVTNTVLGAVKAVLAGRPRQYHRFVVLVDDRLPRHFHAPLVGLFRTVFLENPAVRGRVVRVAGLDTADTEDLQRILREEAADDSPYAEVRRAADGSRHVRRPAGATEVRGPEAPPLRDGGVYWVTGGLGGLGRHVARYFARCDRVTVVLSGRAPSGPDTETVLRSLRAEGVDAHYLPVDVTVAEDVARAVRAIVETHGSLDGVVHAAGVLRDGYLLRKEHEDLHTVLGPKVPGTLHIDAATRDLDLDFLVLFSSVAGVFGNPGQADYAAANAFLDAFAGHRQALVEAGERTGATLAVSWPLWADGGMRVDDLTRAAMRDGHGWEPLPTEEGVRALGHALVHGPAHIVVAFGEHATLSDTPASRPAAALADTEDRADGSGPAVPGDGNLPSALLSDDALRSGTAALVTRLLGEVLHHDPGTIDPTVNLAEYGIDSLSILDMTARLERLFGSLPKTILFEYLNVDEVTEYFIEAHREKLREVLGTRDEPRASAEGARGAMADGTGASHERDGQGAFGPPDGGGPSAPAEVVSSVSAPPAATPSERVAPDATALQDSPAVAAAPVVGTASLTATERPSGPDDRHDIAIVGISGRYPGATTMDELWELLSEGRHSFEEVPRERWDHDAIYSRDRAKLGKSVIRTGTFLRDINKFDPRYFRVSKRDAEQMSPEVRLFLQLGVEALEDAGYSREQIQRQYQGDVGVLAGTMSNHYGLYGFQNGLVRGARQSGSYNATMPNMLSYFYGLTGPSLFVDTMCSTSSTCVHQAVQMLRAGECSMVVAGGVNLLLHPYNLITSSQEHFTTATSDVIRSYGLGVDGTILGEGAGVVVLKTLADAERDGDHVHAVIKGTAITNAGPRNGFTVPSVALQARAVEKALDDAGVDARTISYVEGHGSGTSLGDPIEVKALNDAFRRSTGDTGFCALGSVKSNMGHLLAAAGVLGIAKVVLQLREGRIAPSLHSDELNRDIPFDSTPFQVQRRLADWPRPVTMVDGAPVEHPRRAGVTSIGAGGMNSHLVLEEYSPVPAPRHDGRHELFVFSAMTDEALEAYLVRFREFLVMHEDADLASVAFTLRVGKNELPRRWAFLAADRRGVVEAVDRYLAGDRDAELALAGTGPAAAAARETGLAWTGGRKADWSVLDAGRRLRRLPLPAYPFAQVDCWVEEDPTAPSVIAPLVFRDVLHPFLGRNESDLDGLRYAVDVRLDDLLDYGQLRDEQRAVVPTFVVDAALACVRVSGFATGARIRDLRTAGRADWAKVARLVTTFAAADGTGFGTVFTEDASGTRTPLATFAAHAGDGSRAEPLRDERGPGDRELARDAVEVLTQVQFLAELAEGGIEHPPMFDGVRVARVLRDGCLVLDVSVPDFQQNHVKRNVAIEPAVLAAVAHGAQLVAKRAGLPAWARLVPRRIDEVAVSADGIADVERIVLDLVPSTEGLGGRVLLLDGSGRLIGELTDVWWGDEDAASDALRPTRRSVPISAAERISVSARVPDGAEAAGTGTGIGTGGIKGTSSGFESRKGSGPGTETSTDLQAETLTSTGAGSDGSATVAFVADELRVIAAGILGFEADEIEPTTGFYAFGFDSISLVTLAERVGKRFGLRVSPALFFDLDTLDALARYLVVEFGDRIPSVQPSSPVPDTARAAAHPAVAGRPEHPAAPSITPAPTVAAELVAPEPAVPAADGPGTRALRGTSPAGETALAPVAVTSDGSGTPVPVAIVGAAGRFPGARDLDAYWANLVGGVDSVTEFPAHRYDETYARVVEAADFPPYAAVINDVDAFDAGFFGIYPREAELLDPQHRLALETVWSALEDSAHRPADLPADTGVFLGVSGTDYATLLTGYGVAPDAFTATGNAHSMLANRVSFTLDVRGPSEPVDTACSSSLVALHRALEAIRSGVCSMAVAGGVNLLLSTDTFVSAHQAGMLSPDGRCQTFSADANGYVRGEGVGAVVLKPLAAAERDGDAVLGVLLGSAENHGGRAHSLTAPNADAQAEVVAAAVGDTDPDTIGYIETHGTGTALGDPVEIRALRSAFQRLGAAGQGACGLGSVKTNIGHLEAAAGIAGLLKVLLAMEHGVIPGTLHCREVNPHIELDDGPFRLVRENEAWPRPTGSDGTPAPRRAGVSSFGFGGANCHVVVEEYTGPADAVVDAADDRTETGAVLVPLSANSEEQLREVAGNLLDRLRDTRRVPVPLASLAWTLQTGRETLPERVGWVVESSGELAAVLQEFVTWGRPGNGGLRGTAARTGAGPRRRAAAGEPVAGAGLREVLQRWTSGSEPDWRTLYGVRTPRRVHLPTYPFARDRYWIPGHPPRGRASDTDGAAPAPAIGTFLRVPRWIPRPAEASTSRSAESVRRVVVLAEAPDSARAVLEEAPGVRCVSVASSKERLDSWFRDVTRQYLEAVRDAAADERPGGTLVQAVVPADGARATALALTGLMRTAALEHPHLTCQVIGFDAFPDPAVLRDVLDTDSRTSGDDVVLHRDGVRLVRAWELVSAPLHGDVGMLRPDGIYLITGGAGGVGAAVARWIAKEAVRPTVVLVGRSPRDARTEELVADLRAAGAVARYDTADVSRWEETRHLVADVRHELGRIDGVFHAAGVIHDSLLTAKTGKEWEDVLAPKSDALVNLDRALGRAPLDFLIAFSSGAAVTGNPGQSDYATANAFLDEFAALRTRRAAVGERSGRTLSVAWPLWEDGGMPLSPEALTRLWESRGLTPMSSADGIAALTSAWRLGADRVWVHHGRLSATGAVDARAGSGLGTDAVSGAGSAAVSGTENGTLAAPVADGPEVSAAVRPGSAESLRRLVRIFAQVTKMPAHEVNVDEPLHSAGLDSIMVIQLNRELTLAFGDVPRTLFYDLPTLRAIAERLAAETPSAAPEPVAAVATDEVRPAPSGAVTAVRETALRVTEGDGARVREPIAVIGMSGRYPKAGNLEEFWTNLRDGRDCIGEIPADRWPLEGFYEPDRRKAQASGMSYSKWGGFLDDFASFDPLFFQVAPRDAYAMDPQERLFLQASWEVMEDAGYTRESLRRRHQGRVGVFAGVTKSGHARHGVARLQSGETVVPALSFASLSARTSYLLDLNGPSMTIDTMCSASLTAVHEACEHLYRGACDVAVAGGVNLYLHPLDYVELCRSGMLSEDSRCRSFGSGGHGFVPGEGVGCVLLKPLSRAEADGDRILAVIRGTSVNHGGRSNGYTVPRSGAQAELIRDALNRAGVSARDIGYVEAHGTGTELGDPVEIQGLTTAFEQDTAERQFCAIGSAKSAVGHLEAAAGIAGLAKAVLQLRHRQFAPSLHAEVLNPNIAFERTPFFVQREAAPWPAEGRPRIAAVSSFGAGGSNAHVIVEEYPSPQIEEHAPRMAQSSANGTEHIVVLSARTPEQLNLSAAKLAEFSSSTDVDLADLAFTLQTGREAMRERLALVVSSTANLRETLSGFLADGVTAAGGTGVHRGSPAAAGSGLIAELADDDVRELLVERWARAGKLSKLAAVWVEGLEIDWEPLHAGAGRRRIALPTYPFARERYWIGDLEPVAPAGRSAELARITRESVQPGQSGTVTPAPAPAPAAIAPLTSVEDAQARPGWSLDVEVPRIVRAVLARALAMREEDIAATAAFADYGLDSILAVRVAHELGEELSLDLDTGILFDHSTARRLTAHLLAAYRDDIGIVRPVARPEPPAAASPAPEQPATARPMAQQEASSGSSAAQARPPIAVIGMSGRFAGSRSLDELWAHLAAGDDLITTTSRWDAADGADARGPLRGGFLEHVDEFDSLFFNVSGVEARGMDPQQRLFMEETWKALEDAGYPARAMNERRCGVYVGCWAGDYPGGEGESAPVQGLWGTMGSVIPGRVSYFLNLRGPALAIDTSCSSSLVAIDLACKDLWSGETTMALAGGVFVQATPRLYQLAGRAGMLSPSGRCHTFDHRADGFVPGEGVGVVVLKRLDDALADGDHIHGVIRGSGVNHDGATNGLTAPSSLSQERLLRDVYDTFDVDARRIGMVEAHGTGTKLGDPIEFGALARAFRESTDASGYCALGSVKTNLGHTQFAAGVAGVLKVLLALRHRRIPASLHFEEANGAIALKDSPFYVNTRTQPWYNPDGVPRVGTVSAFGASGTNAHVVLEEAPERVRAALPHRAAHLVVLSAHSREQLCEQVERLAAHCRSHPEQGLGDLSYTLTAGREHFRYRFACVVRDHDDLVRVLEAGTTGPHAVAGDAGADREPDTAGLGRETLRRCADPATDPHTLRAELATLADLFVNGADLAYEEAFTGGVYCRVPLPTYPFARVSHWAGADLPAEAQRAQAAPAEAPTVSAKTPSAAASGPSRARVTFAETRRFLDDHVVQGQHVLPGVVYLETARAAAAQLLGASPADAVCLRNVTWVRPVVADDTAPDGALTDVELLLRPASGGVAFEFRSTDEEAAVYCEGRLTRSDEPRPPRTSPSELRAACQTTVSGEQIHAALVARGIDHGPALRAVREAHTGPGLVVAELHVPGTAPTPERPFVLHPSLLDSAIQSSVALLLAGDGIPEGTSVPFALEQLDVFAPCAPSMWAVVRTADPTAAENTLSRLDIDLVDTSGEVCVRMTGYTARRVATPPPSLFAPIWDVLPLHALTGAAPGHDDHVLVVGGDAEQRDVLARRFARTTIWHLPATAPADDVADALRASAPVDHLVWIAPDTETEPADADRLVTAQTDGVVAAFRMIKSLLRTDHDRRPLSITLVTRHALATHTNERPRPAHAGLHGLFGSLAQEYTNWSVRRVDLGEEPWPTDLMALPTHARTDSWAHRSGQWLTRRWAPCDVAATPRAPYREGGVYVVVGGAGGLGTEWTRHVVERFGAHVVWIGRSPEDAAVKGRMDSVRGRGSVRYVRADATDHASLRDAFDRIRSEFPRIHGVVHAALVLRDQSFAGMNEETLLASLSAKVDAAVTTARVLDDEELDFALFFSSVQSFATTAGQGNYAAGSAFLDAYARLLGRHWSCPVKVMNWGWWGSQGSVSSDYYRQRMERAGLVSIEAPEAMNALNVLLGGPYDQLGFVKLTSIDALTAVEPSVRTAVRTETVTRVPAHALTTRETPREEQEVLRAVAAWREEERDPLLGQLLRAHLVALGALTGGEDAPADADAEACLRRAGIQERYLPWLRQALRVVPDSAAPLDTLLTEWDERRQAWSADPGLKSELELVDATLRALPEILTGVRRPTDIMFPRGSFELVEGCYRDTPVADAFNHAVQDTVVGLVTERLRQDPGARIRVLEIGAGTGGTSTGLFRALRPHQDSIDTYLYTDLSKAFLNNARRVHGPHVPYLDCALFDVERPLAGQGIEEGGYDIVVAANVLHATVDIRNTLRNAKAALRGGGWLVLNELSRFDVFSHLTFGLLEGWWLSADTGLRIPGSPALSPEGWRDVLHAEGFQTVLSVLPQADALGQQIIAAESDGTTRQLAPGRQATPVVPAPVSVPEPEPRPERDQEPELRAAPAGTAEALADYLRESAATVLGVPAERIDPAVPLTSYGLDSLLVLQLTQVIRTDLGDDVSSALLFEVESVDGLVEHFLAERAPAVDALVAARPTTRETAGPRTEDAPRREAETTERWALSRSQGRLWRRHLRHPDAATYNIPLLFEIHGAFDVDALEEACRTQPRRHPILGAVFHETDGVPRMEIDRARAIPFTRTRVTAAARDEQLHQIKKLADQPFDLAAGPLARAHIVTLDPGTGDLRHLLLVTVHHIVMDGTSAAVLVRSLKDAYGEAVGARTSPITPLEHATYADFVAWETALLDSPKARRHRDYWLAELRGPRGELTLPRDRKDTAALPPRSGIILTRLTPDVTEAFAARARAHQTSAATLFLATYTVFLHSLTGQSDLVVGFPTVARYEERFKDVVGQFVNCLPIRSSVTTGEDFSALLGRVGRAVVRGIDHGAYPALEIERALAEEEGRPSPDLVVTNLLFQNFDGASLFTGAEGTVPGPLDLRPFDDLPDSGEMPVTVEIYQGPDGYKLFLKYDANAFEASTARAMADELSLVVEYVAHEVDFRIGATPWRDRAERPAATATNEPDEQREGNEHA
ncbi:SDR family NAD(P)-dependent oxidoreductase [Streptomyces sp. NPDC002769]|uniref:SDR family NAD(P)-dependent oxidoreductase n=1 Tax=Streptomyces sp. NPDC002769 TaxID=3154542 RepID=UPI00331B2D7D